MQIMIRSLSPAGRRRLLEAAAQAESPYRYGGGLSFLTEATHPDQVVGGMMADAGETFQFEVWPNPRNSMIARNPELYELYRPQRLEDLVGAGAHQLVSYVSSRLQDPTYDRDALMIVGPSGSGKTTSARIIGKHLALNEMDYLEIPGTLAGNIETVRTEIVPWLKTYPWGGGWKVLVVDEAQRLSDVAKDAFLNIVENLSQNHMVIFTATPDWTGGLPFQPALISRFKLFQFTQPGIEDVARVLNRIAQGQGWPPPRPEVISSIFVKSQGNIRQAIQLYEIFQHTGTVGGSIVAHEEAPAPVYEEESEIQWTLDRYQSLYKEKRDRMTAEQKQAFLAYAKERVSQIQHALQMPAPMAWRTLQDIRNEMEQMIAFMEVL